MASNSIVVKVQAVDAYGQTSGFLLGTFANPAPSTPSGLSSSPWMNGIEFTWDANIENDLDYYSYRYQIESEGWSGWITTAKDSRRKFFFLDDTQTEAYPNGATIYFEVKAVDTFGNESSAASDSDTSGSLYIPYTALSDFEQISRAFYEVPVLRDFTWVSNDPSAGYISWTSGTLWWNGTGYSITGSNTNTHWVYWDPNGTTTIFVGTDDDSTIPEGSVVIAINNSGTCALVWNNAVANQVIGSAWIRDAAIITAKINNLAVTTAKINDLAVTTAKIANLAVTNAQINDLSASKINAGSMNASYITAGTLTATQINGSGFGNLTISSGTITIQTSNGLTISGSGNIKVEAGNDINFIGSDSDPGKINFVGTSYTVSIGGNADGSVFAIEPVTDDAIDFYIGESNFWYGYRFSNLYLRAEDNSYLESGNATTNYARVQAHTESSYSMLLFNAVNDAVTTAGTIVLYNDGSGGTRYLSPSVYKSLDLAQPAYAFDDAYADDWNNVADVPFLDDRDDISAIVDIKGSSVTDERTGFQIINDSTLKPWFVSKYKRDTEEKIPYPEKFNEEEYKLWKIKYLRGNGLDTDYKRILREQIENAFPDYEPEGHQHWVLPGDRVRIFKKGTTQYSPEGKPYISTKTHLGLHDGCFRQLVDEQQQVHTMLEYQQNRINGLEKQIKELLKIRRN